MKTFIYLLFVISGSLGLIYQVVWARLLVLVFGNTTASTSVVLSVFMAGLALGSVVAGKFSDHNKPQQNINFWAISEILIGTTAIISLILFPWITQIYSGTLINKLLFAALLILPSTFFMGSTLPLLIKAFSTEKNLAQQTSRLYFINTLGAFLGTLFSAFILIELFGIFNTVIIAGISNALLGILGLNFKFKFNLNKFAKTKTSNKQKAKNQVLTLVLLTFFLSGAISFSYEIIWTRILIASVGTYTYAFAVILAVILAGIAFGSILAYKLITLSRDKIQLYALIQGFIGLGALSSLVILSINLQVVNLYKLVVVLTPTAILMGTTFPIVASLFEGQKNTGFSIGLAYGLNTAGSIVGPLVTGFILIGLIGTSQTMLLLAIFNFLIAISVSLQNKRKVTILPAFFFILLIFSLMAPNYFPQYLIESSIKNKIALYEQRNYEWQYLEDQTASILAFAGPGEDPSNKGLIIDGVQTTTLTIQTKLLAHLPLLVHPKPQNMLIIAFGMGTTYRSALIHDIQVDAVELVPSVPKTFNMFYHDGQKVLNNPKGRIILNDGRNYVRMTNKKYDTVVIDPPPPINAAGTTVLYSKQFYEDTKKILNPNGILVAWFWYGAPTDDFQMLFSAMREVFPEILIAVSPDGRGVFLLGSETPITLNKDQITNRYQGKIYKDLNEWNSEDYTTERIMELFVGDQNTVDRFINGTEPLTDYLPRTEYFFLRHRLNPQPNIDPAWVHPIPLEFDQRHGIIRK